MALVAYANSDSSDYEDDDHENGISVQAIAKKFEGDPSVSASTQSFAEPEAGPSLFNHLPLPTTKKPTIIEEDDEFLHKKENAINIVKPKTKITVPSLSDFKDVEDRPNPKPKLSNGKKCGLLSMLPQPRNTVTSTTRSLIPNVLTKKPTATAKKKEPLPSPAKKLKTNIKSLVSHSDDSEDEEVENDFFSINKHVELPADVPLDIDEPSTKVQPEVRKSNQKPRNIESYFKKDVVENQMDLEPSYDESESSMAMEYTEASSSVGYGLPESSNSGDAVLDEEAILKLCGTRGKRKREDIQIVDVNQQDVLAEARQMLMKGLLEDTSKRMSSSKKKGNEPTSQQKRKHQITYLAHQAKANETELQNQWANNRMSRRQTQSKYGF